MNSAFCILLTAYFLYVAVSSFTPDEALTIFQKVKKDIEVNTNTSKVWPSHFCFHLPPSLKEVCHSCYLIILNFLIAMISVFRCQTLLKRERKQREESLVSTLYPHSVSFFLCMYSAVNMTLFRFMKSWCKI